MAADRGVKVTRTERIEAGAVETTTGIDRSAPSVVADLGGAGTQDDEGAFWRGLSKSR